MKTHPGAVLLLVLVAAIASASPPIQNTNAEIETRVRAMKKPDVPWRKIAWKTCLLDAIHASKAQGKPIVAWVFIDRPKDDERC